MTDKQGTQNTGQLTKIRFSYKTILVNEDQHSEHGAADCKISEKQNQTGNICHHTAKHLI